MSGAEPLTLTEHFERARELAQRKGHARVTAVHFLLSLSNGVAVQQRMTESGLSLARLDRYTQEALASEPRTGQMPMLDVALEPILANAVTELALYEVLIAPLAADLRFDETPVRRFYDETNAAARGSGHRRKLVEHALYALARRATDEGRFADALGRLGLERRDFRHRIAERITHIQHSAGVGKLPELLQRASAHANSAMRETLGIEVIVVDLLRSPWTRQALEAAGVSHSALLYSYVHGALPPPLPLLHGPADVAIWSDEFTPPDMLANLLTRFFAQPPDAAQAIAQQIREQRRCALRVTDAARAAEAITQTRAEASELGMPVRIELHRAMS